MVADSQLAFESLGKYLAHRPRQSFRQILPLIESPALATTLAGDSSMQNHLLVIKTCVLSASMDSSTFREKVLSYPTIDPAHAPCLGAVIECLGGVLGESRDRDGALELARVCCDRAAEAYGEYPFARARRVRVELDTEGKEGKADVQGHAQVGADDFGNWLGMG